MNIEREETQMQNTDSQSQQVEEPDASKTPPMVTDRDLQHAKHGTAILVTCLVQTLNESDPTFQERLLGRLREAYYEVRDNSDGDVRQELELLSWTQELLTGWNIVTGQGKPFLDGR
jgi:hypothetical protein